MPKLVAAFCVAVLVIFLLVWGAYLARCEVLTLLHEKEFSHLYQENTMISQNDYAKVLAYSNDFARVYCVAENHAMANILTFEKKDDKWVYHEWEQTVWSAVRGSGSEVIWPYVWHFLYGEI